MRIIVRQAVAQDWDAMRQLFLTSRHHTFPWLPTEDFSLTDLDEQTVGEAIWVAQDVEGKLIGFVSIWEAENFIHHLYVDTTNHRRGVGRMLLQDLHCASQALKSLGMVTALRRLSWCQYSIVVSTKM